MKAINERLQEGLDYFMENETWRSIYEDAPEGWRKGVDEKEDIVFFAYTGKTNNRERDAISHKCLPFFSCGNPTKIMIPALRAVRFYILAGYINTLGKSYIPA